MRHGLSPTQPCVTRLGSPFPLWQSGCSGGALMCTPLSTLPFPLAPLHFPMVHHLFCPPPRCFLVSVLTVLPVLVSIRGLPSRFLRPSYRDSHTGSGLAPHRSDTLVIGGFLMWFGGVRVCPECPRTHLLEPGVRHSLPAQGPRVVPPYPQK